MGKITVRHILNKKVSPVIDQDRSFYPVYLQIIYNQFATEKRSDTGVLLTENSFSLLTNSNVLKPEETIFANISCSASDLEKELLRARKSIEIIDKYDFKVTRKSIFTVINDLSMPASDIVRETALNRIKSRLSKNDKYSETSPQSINSNQYEYFLTSFADNIIASVNKIEIFTGYDLKKFIGKSDLIMLEAIQYVEDTGSQKSFAEYAIDGFETILQKIMKEKPLSYYLDIKIEIERLIIESIEFVKFKFRKEQ